MKGLLHSKRFKKNLQNWLLMYVGVMALLTTVITYSKYVAELNKVNDSTHASRFNILVNKIDCPEDRVEYLCNSDSDKNCRPTAEIASCFEVDTTGLDVDSDLLLTFDPALKSGEYYTPNGADNDILYSINKIDFIITKQNTITSNNDFVSVYSKPISGEPLNVSYDSWGRLTTTTNTRITLQRDFNKDTGLSKKWKIRVRMVREENEDKKYDTISSSSNTVRVGYTMEQKGGKKS